MLTKSKLVKLTSVELSACGYTLFKDSISGAQGFFTKKIGIDMYLTLGLIIHRFYENAFTGAFYLSKTTRWASMWGDIPRLCYKKIGDVLEQNENIVLSNENSFIDIDPIGWWKYKNQDTIKHFIEVVKISECKFISQQDLIKQINNSADVALLHNLAKSTILYYKDINLNDEYDFLPSKPIDDIPLAWFKAAEKVLKTSEYILNANTVKFLAADAYRQFILDLKKQ